MIPFGYALLKIFEYVAYVHVQSKERSKLDLRALMRLFFDYSPTHKGLSIFTLQSEKKYITVGVKSFENLPFFVGQLFEGRIRELKI